MKNKIFFTPSVIVCLMFSVYFSLNSWANVSKKEAVDFFKVKYPEFSLLIDDESTSIQNFETPGLFVISNKSINEAFIVKKEKDVVVNHFDKIAKTLGRIFLIVQYFTYVSNFDNDVIHYTSHVDDTRNFAIQITNPDTISEVLRRVHFYSRSEILALRLIENAHIGIENSNYPWHPAFLIDNDKLINAQGVSAALTRFSKHAIEILDGDVVTILKSPSLIAKSPFTRDNIITFNQWSTWADSIVNSEGNVVANRSEIRMVPWGPFAPSSMTYSPRIVEYYNVRPD